MEYFAELMHRLLEIQSGGRERSPKLIAEDARLMAGLRQRNRTEVSAITQIDGNRTYYDRPCHPSPVQASSARIVREDK